MRYAPSIGGTPLHRDAEALLAAPVRAAAEPAWVVVSDPEG
jgi:hypothetical protein